MYSEAASGDFQIILTLFFLILKKPVLIKDQNFHQWYSKTKLSRQFEACFFNQQNKIKQTLNNKGKNF